MYLTITHKTELAFVESKSKFIGILFPCPHLDAFKAELANVKNTYPNASHYCSAGIFGNPFSHRSSDDGEPSGSAGNPMLGQLRAANLVNVACIVVRYYGGTKLGVPGLIKSYKAACFQAIEQTERIPFVKKNILEIRGNYEMLMHFYSKNHKKGWEMKTLTLASEMVIHALLEAEAMEDFKNNLTLFPLLEFDVVPENQ